MRRDLNDLDGAFEAYEAGLAVTRRLAEADPGNARRQWELFARYWQMADNTDMEVEYLEKGLALLERLDAEGERAPNDIDWIETTRRRLEEARQAAGRQP